MAWPGPNPTFSTDEELAEARAAWAYVARAVRRFEPVTMVHGPGQGDSARDSALDVSELAAYTGVASLLLNLDEAVTKQ
jgi:hypothetical protein